MTDKTAETAVEITFLGTGTSQGIPLIACQCPVCMSPDPRDRRTRTSAVVHLDGRNILIDASPELRLQCIAAGIDRLDAVLLTHTHADHFLGLDDLRRFTQLQRRPLDVYVPADRLASVERVFGYARYDRAADNPDLPHLRFQAIDGPFELFGHTVTPIPLPHGRTQTTGYRIGRLAYCTDCSDLPDEALAALEGLGLLVLGALREKPHPAHLSLAQACAFAERLGPALTYLVHMSHHVSHAATDAALPGNVRLAYDTLRLGVP